MAQHISPRERNTWLMEALARLCRATFVTASVLVTVLTVIALAAIAVMAILSL
jgi:hypothetical protein